MSCKNAESAAALDALLAGDITARQYEALRTHAGSCDSCRAEYERISQIDSRLERRALPARRQELLEGELFARLGLAVPQAPNVIRPARWTPRRVAALALPLAASVALAVLVAPQLRSGRSDEFQPRGGAAGTAYGIRAFCVEPTSSAVVGEALPGETLACAPGQSIQFSHTSPEPVTLRIVGAGKEPLSFFPAEGPAQSVPAGTDVPLSFSTPVQTDWLDRPVPVTATFLSADGKVVAESRLVIAPAK